MSFADPMTDTHGGPPEFGILNFRPTAVTSPPEFTEQATIDAMRNLQVLPSDLVPHDPPEVDDVVRRLHLTMELERRRYETINQIKIERNRLLALAGDAPMPPPARISTKRSPSGDLPFLRVSVSI
jgi:hypothetical protein